ncbi:hypothetical protein AB0H71_18305 [Nocardia sp. NPDC050697]|uniref:hypothetical protein n=1 Tax=Nocardia sp. NPDC050697 TaxID=3155158 RepID=UPI0033F38265
MLRRVARALHIPLAILVTEDEEEADVQRREFFRAGAIGAGAVAGVATAPSALGTSGTPRIGASDIAALADSVEQLHSLDLVLGGDRLRGLAAGQVRYARQLLGAGSYSDAVGQELAGTTAELMTAAGWVEYDSGHPGKAARYYTEAAQTATAADDGIAAAHALGNASHLMVNRLGSETSGDRLAVQYAQAATRAAAKRGGPGLRALMALREAEANGARGDRVEMARAVSRAFRAYDSSRGFDPGWVYLPQAEMSGVSGKAHMRIGDHAAAVAHFRDAIAGSSAWPRERASWQLHLTHNLIRSGDVAAACGQLTDTFATITELASARLQRRLADVIALVRPHSAVPEARELLGLWVSR